MNEILRKTITIIFWVITVSIVLAFVGLEIYAFVMYSNTPAEEVPLWVIWLLWGEK